MATDRHQAPSYPLRMPDDLKSKVAEAAGISGRSLHAELIHRITESFDVLQGRADMARVLMDLAESRLQTEQCKNIAIGFATAFEFLMDAMTKDDPRAEAERFEAQTQAFVDLLPVTRQYEKDLNARRRLEEYRLAVEEAERNLDHWRTMWRGDVPSRPEWPLPGPSTGSSSVKPSRRKTKNAG